MEERSAGAVIFLKTTELKFLILNYPSGHWDFVKGNIEKGETHENTIIRETKEETGIQDLKIINGFNKEVQYSYFRKQKKINKKVFYYLAETNTKKIKISFEHIGYKWLTFNDMTKTLTYESSLGILKEAKKSIDNINEKPS